MRDGTKNVRVADYTRGGFSGKVKVKQRIESHLRATLATCVSQISHWFVVGISFGSTFLEMLTEAREKSPALGP